MKEKANNLVLGERRGVKGPSLAVNDKVTEDKVHQDEHQELAIR